MVQRGDDKEFEGLNPQSQLRELDSTIDPTLVGADGGSGLVGDDFGQWEEPVVVARPAQDLIGQTLAGRYRVLDVLGRGGMGTVYLAEQLAVKRTVAIKVLHREYAEKPEIVRRFHREALAVSQLVHPNTISVFDFGDDEGRLFIAMEHLRGRTLQDELATGKPMPLARAVYICQQLLKSVAEAHELGIIHRDLKPENIYLIHVDGRDDFVKVLDFGVAKLRNPGGDQATLTQAGTVFGTPKYMAPEQSRDGTVDQRADLYSIGVILYEMLLGRPPFESDNPLSLLLSHASKAPPRFLDVQPNQLLDERVESVVLTALAKAPDERYQSAELMSRDLDILLNQSEHDLAKLPDLVRALASAGAAADDLPVAQERAEHLAPRPKASGWSGLAWVLALSALVIATALWFSRSPEQAISPRTSDETSPIKNELTAPPPPPVPTPALVTETSPETQSNTQDGKVSVEPSQDTNARPAKKSTPRRRLRSQRQPRSAVKTPATTAQEDQPLPEVKPIEEKRPALIIEPTPDDDWESL